MRTALLMVGIYLAGCLVVAVFYVAAVFFPRERCEAPEQYHERPALHLVPPPPYDWAEHEEPGA